MDNRLSLHELYGTRTILADRVDARIFVYNARGNTCLLTLSNFFRVERVLIPAFDARLRISCRKVILYNYFPVPVSYLFDAFAGG